MKHVYGTTSTTTKTSSVQNDQEQPKPSQSSVVVHTNEGSESYLPYCRNSSSFPTDDVGQAQSCCSRLQRSIACFFATHLIEQMTFIQNLAENTVSFSYDQFIYNRFLTRLTNSKNNNVPGAHTRSLQAQANCPSSNSSNSSGFWTESDIIDQAQEQTSAFLYTCQLYMMVPYILATIFMCTHCSRLGRKTVIATRLVICIFRYSIISLQCFFPLWPDWIFYANNVLEGFSGGTSCFYLGSINYFKMIFGFYF